MQWIAEQNGCSFDDLILKQIYVCSLHFQDDLRCGNNKRLKVGAVPSVGVSADERAVKNHPCKDFQTNQRQTTDLPSCDSVFVVGDPYKDFTSVIEIDLSCVEAYNKEQHSSFPVLCHESSFTAKEVFSDQSDNMHIESDTILLSDDPYEKYTSVIEVNVGSAEDNNEQDKVISVPKSQQDSDPYEEYTSVIEVNAISAIDGNGEDKAISVVESLEESLNFIGTARLKVLLCGIF